MPLHEEINDKSISLGARVGRITADELRKAIDKMLSDIKSRKNSNAAPDEKNKSSGKKTMKQLSAQGDGLSSIELSDPELRLLYHEMKRHNVDFSPMKDGKGKYTLFFKAKDADAMTHAFQSYTQKLTQRANNQTIKKQLSAAKAAAKTLNVGRDKVKNKGRGEREI